MAKKILVIISGPSGVGKTTIIDELLLLIPNSARFVTTTTRSPRPGEESGKDYHFLTREEFLTGVEKDEFVEWVESYGDFYGTSRVKLAGLFETYSAIFVAPDTRGVFSLKEEFPLAVSIFVKSGSIEELEQRIRNRGNVSPEKAKKRLDAVAAKMAQADKFDYVVTNTKGKLEEAVAEILAILRIIAEKQALR